MSSRATDPIEQKSGDPASQERRADPRLPLHLPALLGLGDSVLRACVIRSYSDGGLLLDIDRIDSEPLVADGRRLTRGDRVKIRFSIAVNAVDMEFETQARVARMDRKGIGVAFTERDSQAVNALKGQALVYQENLARRRPRATRVPPETASRRSGEHAWQGPELITTCREITANFFDERLPGLFDEANEKLFEGASRGATDAEQMECFDAMQELEKLREVVAENFRAGVLEQMDDLWAGEFSPEADAPEQLGSELSLVDTCGFDDWLMVAAIISRARVGLDEGQQALERRLARLVGMAIVEETNPVGLQRVCYAFHDAVQNLGAVKRTRRSLFEALGRSFVAGLSELHDALNAALDEGGIRDEEPPGCALPTRTVQREDRAVSTTPETKPPAGAGDRGATVDEANRIDTPPTGSQHTGAAASVGAPPVSAATTGGPAGTSGPRLAQAFRTAADMMRVGRTGHASPGETPASLTSIARQVLDASAAAQASGRSLDSALAALQREGAQTWGETGPLALGERLRVGLLSDGVDLDDSTAEVTDVISKLMDAILDDPLIHPDMKVRIRRLALPLVRIALIDESFFTDESHVARDVINALGELEPTAADGSQSLLCDSVDPEIDKTLRQSPVSSEALVEARSILVALVERQRAERADNVERLVVARKAQLAAVEALRGGAASASPATTTSAMRADTDTWRRLLDRLARLKVDDVLVRDAGTPKARPAILTWVADDGQTFLLVNRAGEQAEYLTQQEMAMGLHRGSLQADSSAKLPVVERNVYRMLHGLHDRLERDAVRDPLTGLLNRKQLAMRLKAAVDRAGRVTSFLCVLGIDDFEAIVDRCGRRAGETLMVKLARVLEKQAGACGLVSRLDGERFAILFHGAERSEVVDLVERQRRSVEQSLCYHNGKSFGFRLSFGLTEISGDAHTPEAVLKAAKHALAEACKAGGNRLHWHGRAGRDKRRPRPATGTRPTVADLIEQDGLGLRCQRVEPISPQVGTLPYYEILLGVKGPEGRLDPPGKVIAEAESQGQIETLDHWVIREVFAWMAQDAARLDNVCGYAINLSGITLSRERLLGYVLEQLAENRLPPGKVIFEVTETAGIDSLSIARHFVTTLRDNGCRFSLDDFGAGHASLAYLKQLPVDNVKIDGLFVKDMMTNEADHAMVKSINDIAHFMGRKTVAEFVEDESILSGLRELGVDYAQGYGVERPIPVTELAERWHGPRGR